MMHIYDFLIINYHINDIKNISLENYNDGFYTFIN